MRYFAAMMFVPTLSALIASFAAAPQSPAVRHDTGPSVAVAVRARIIRSSARVGAGLAPPLPRMTPRRTTVSAADGRLVPALVYDFE